MADEKIGSLVKRIKKVFPTSRYLLVSIIMTPLYWGLNVLAYDVYDLPAWLFTLIIGGFLWTIRFNIVRRFVFK